MKDKSNHNFELFCTNLKIKANEEEDTLVIEGYANTTTKDRQGDVILEEAWTKGGLDNYLKNPIVLAFHNPEKPIGEVTDYGINNKGLHVVAEISKAAGDVYKLIKEGILKAFSVGFRVKDAEYDQTTDIFVIKDLEMYELSVVSIPANADSIFSVRKSFEIEEDYLNFKEIYTKQEQVETKVETPVIKENKNVEDDNKISLTADQLAAEKEKAVKDALAAIDAEKARKEEIAKIALEASTTGAERLQADLEKRLLEKEETLQSVLNEFRSELKEKSDELEALRNSKITFEKHNGSGKDQFTQQEIDTAVLASIAMNKGIDKLEYTKKLFKTKSTGEHLSNMTDDWENLFSTRLYEDIKDKTIIEPLFNNRIQMTSRTMTYPWNPEAGWASWIPDTDYAGHSTFGETDDESTGTAQIHRPNDDVIKAEKLATKEYLGYEEEEDSIIPIMPIIRDALVRRMVRSTDQELMLGDVGTTLNSGSGLIDGFATLADDVANEYVQPTAFGNAATIADLQQVRRKMGVYGLMPGECVYVVSQNVYYDLLEDPDFRTVDVIGDRATILRGQIGSVNGSPVLVSDSFKTDAVNEIQAVCLNQANYLFGELRGLMVERDKNIERQKNIIVATRRFAFKEIITGSTGRGAAAVLKRAAA